MVYGCVGDDGVASRNFLQINRRGDCSPCHHSGLQYRQAGLVQQTPERPGAIRDRVAALPAAQVGNVGCGAGDVQFL